MASRPKPHATGKTKPGDVSERVGVEQIEDVPGELAATHKRNESLPTDGVVAVNVEAGDLGGVLVDATLGSQSFRLGFLKRDQRLAVGAAGTLGNLGGVAPPRNKLEAMLPQRAD